MRLFEQFIDPIIATASKPAPARISVMNEDCYLAGIGMATDRETTKIAAIAE